MGAILLHATALSQYYVCRWTEYFHHTSIIHSRTPTSHIHIQIEALKTHQTQLDVHGNLLDILNVICSKIMHIIIEKH